MINRVASERDKHLTMTSDANEGNLFTDDEYIRSAMLFSPRNGTEGKSDGRREEKRISAFHFQFVNGNDGSEWKTSDCSKKISIA